MLPMISRRLRVLVSLLLVSCAGVSSPEASSPSPSPAVSVGASEFICGSRGDVYLTPVDEPGIGTPDPRDAAERMYREYARDDVEQAGEVTGPQGDSSGFVWRYEDGSVAAIVEVNEVGDGRYVATSGEWCAE